MRALAYAFLLWAWALSPGCLSAPRAKDWLAVGFRTPEQTFRTFQTGLRAGLPELEYRCLGDGFKRRAAGEVGTFSLLAYAEYRRELFKAQPWLKLAAKARIRSVKELAPDRVQILAEVDTWFHDESFTVELVREDFYELWSAASIGPSKKVADDFADWSRIARARGDSLVVTVPLPEGRTVADLGELRAGGEWKIDGFPLPSRGP
jgi:hypothetical protein